MRDEQGDQGRDKNQTNCHQPRAIFGQPQLQAVFSREVVKRPVRAKIMFQRRKQIIRLVWISRFGGLLGFVSGQVMIQNSRCDFVSDDGLDGRETDVNFPALVRRGKNNGVGRDFRLKNRGHRLGLVRKFIFHPAKLRVLTAGISTMQT